ncbi:MAG: hypothetical protein JO248_08690 [Acidimicrobiia bacterium]|nr:hypothetical protein [Acidimicrobiia bacterium]MBV8984498.1 hypothetical protein [Acidimicrobiia bacterium]
MEDGGRHRAPTVLAEEAASVSPRTRALAAALTFELLWLLLVTASVVFFAAHLGPRSDDFSGDATVRGVLLVVVPPLAVVIGLALVGARQAVERAAAPNGPPLTNMLRIALWTAAIANGGVVLSILTSLYHAHTTWIAVGVVLAAALSAVGWACARTARAR